MKNRISILGLLAFLLSTVQTYGQENAFSIGPRVGINYANVSNVDDSESKLGLVAGVTATYSILENSGISMDVLFSREGYSIEDGDDVHFDYLRVPIYYNLFFGELGNAFRPKIYLGVAPAFLLSAESDDTDIKDLSAGFEFAVTGGFGFNYRISDRIWLNTDLRAFLGLTDIRDDDFQDDDKVTNQNISLSVGIAYGLSRL